MEEVQIDERSYSSARLRTMSPVSFLTGRIEARIRVPSGQGLWAAFWMLPANQSRGDWAATGEIDIMEVCSSYVARCTYVRVGPCKCFVVHSKRRQRQRNVWLEVAAISRPAQRFVFSFFVIFHSRVGPFPKIRSCRRVVQSPTFYM